MQKASMTKRAVHETGFDGNEEQSLTSTQTKMLLYMAFTHLRHPPNFCFPASIQSMKTNYT